MVGTILGRLRRSVRLPSLSPLSSNPDRTCPPSQFAVIHREHALLASARKSLALGRNKALHAKTVGTAQNEIATEKAEILRIQKKEASLKTDLLVQIGYLPLTMHWCVTPIPPWRNLTDELEKVSPQRSPSRPGLRRYLWYYRCRIWNPGSVEGDIRLISGAGP